MAIQVSQVLVDILEFLDGLESLDSAAILEFLVGLEFLVSADILAGLEFLVSADILAGLEFLDIREFQEKMELQSLLRDLSQIMQVFLVELLLEICG